MRTIVRLSVALVVVTALSSTPTAPVLAHGPGGGGVGPTWLMLFGHNDLGHDEFQFFGLVANPVEGLYVIIDGVIGPIFADVDPEDGTWSVTVRVPPGTIGGVEATLYTPFAQPINQLDDSVYNP